MIIVTVTAMNAGLTANSHHRTGARAYFEGFMVSSKVMRRAALKVLLSKSS